MLNVIYITNFVVTIIENIMAGTVQKRGNHPQRTHKIVSTILNNRQRMPIGRMVVAVTED